MVFSTILFLIDAPLCTFALLLQKGLPPIAAGHVFDVVIWVYQVTWVPALVSGLLLSATLRGIRPWFPYFTKPYDFGRCFSLGAITGALAEAVATGGYRWMTHHAFSGFWIADAMIAGCLAGAGISVITLGRFAKSF